MLLLGAWSLSQHPSQVALPPEQLRQLQAMESGGRGLRSLYDQCDLGPALNLSDPLFPYF